MDCSAAAASEYQDTVRPAWIDNNAHMNLAFYVLVFEGALEALRVRLGLPGALRVAEMHTAYEREVALGDRLGVRTHLLGRDGARLHLFQEMFHREAGYRAATLETVVEHAGPIGAGIAAAIAALVEPAPPPGAGRRIAMPVPR